MQTEPLRRAHQTWDTMDVRCGERFEYYREAICEAFMELAPERSRRGDLAFQAKVETVPVGDGAVNRVEAASHRVTRTKREIGRSAQECFYLNLQRRGECHIDQGRGTTILRRGDVGLFSSSRPFVLEHERRPVLGVSSFWVPREALTDRLPGATLSDPLRLSDNPAVGHLIRETALSLSEEAEWLDATQARKLFDVLLDLTAIAISGNDRAVAYDVGKAHRDGALMVVKRFVAQNIRRSDLNAAMAARHLGMSRRTLHRLFEETAETFARHVMEKRLTGIANDLRRLSNAHHSITSLAFDWGFKDAAHFSRAFKHRFGVSPRAWRHGEGDEDI